MYKAGSLNAILGEDGTQRLVKALEGDGFSVERLDTLFGDCATLMRTKEGTVRAPDIEAKRAGRTAFIDSKAKTHSTWHYVTGEEWHGIDKAKWDDYAAASRDEDVDGYIAVVEWKREIGRGQFIPSGVILMYSMDRCGAHYNDKAKYMEGGGMFWDRNSFEKSYPILPLDTPGN